jgi:choline kinase
MRLFILAAGTGSRLYPLTKDTPKSLLDIGGGATLLERQIQAACASSLVREIVIITGYRSAQVDDWLAARSYPVPVRPLFNPFYRTTNNLVSLWCARQLMEAQDFIVTNGDNLYQNGAFAQAAAASTQHAIALTISRKSHYDEDDMKVRLDANSNVLRVGKDLPAETANAESIGLAFIRGETARRRFAQTIDQLLQEPDNHNRFWLLTFNALIENGVTVSTVPVSAGDWAEVDFHPDVDTVRNKLAAEIGRTDAELAATRTA